MVMVRFWDKLPRARRENTYASVTNTTPHGHIFQYETFRFGGMNHHDRAAKGFISSAPSSAPKFVILQKKLTMADHVLFRLEHRAPRHRQACQEQSLLLHTGT
jgi:hypothetical protein